MTRWFGTYISWAVMAFVIVGVAAFVVAGGEMKGVPVVLAVLAVVAWARARVIGMIARYVRDRMSS